MSLSKDELEYLRSLHVGAIEILDTVLEKKGDTQGEFKRFDLEAIKWLDKQRTPAPLDAPWSWTYVYDIDGEIHPEVEPLYNEICMCGEVHTQGFIITLGGNDKRLLSKRIAKEGQDER